MFLFHSLKQCQQCQQDNQVLTPLNSRVRLGSRGFGLKTHTNTVENPFTPSNPFRPSNEQRVFGAPGEAVSGKEVPAPVDARHDVG